MRTGRYAIIEQFLADGITHMIGNPGSTEQGFMDAIEDYKEFNYILALEEGTAVAIADGFARKTKRPAVVQLHSGVGLGNGIGMIYQAMKGHSPLVIIAGEAGIKYDAMEAHMAADLVAMAKPVTKWAARVVDPSSLLRILKRAIKVASTPPMGPVFISLPADILDAPNDEIIVPTTSLYTQTMPEESKLEEVASLLVNAKNPAFLIGDGVAYSKAQAELEKLAERLGAEVWGADSSEMNMKQSDPRYKGLTGRMFGSDSKKALEKSDVVLIVGTYIFPEVFPLLKDVFSEGTRLIHIDLNAYEIAKNFNVDIGIVSDPFLTLKHLNVMVEKQQSAEQKQVAEQRNAGFIDERRQKREEEMQRDESLWNSVPIHPSQFMRELSRYIPKETIIFDEALTCTPELNRYIQIDEPDCYFKTRNFSLGVGFPGAVGVKLAAPDKTVIGFTGDGSSMYTIQALWTAAHYNIGTKFIVCNNKSYRILKDNIVHYWSNMGITKRNFPDSFFINSPEINFVKLAESLGVPAVRVEKPNEIGPAIEKMLGSKEPFLIDLVVQQG